MELGASPEGVSAPGDSDGEGSDEPVFPVGGPEIDALGVVGGDVEVHAEMTSSKAISGTAGARDEPIRARYQAPTRSPAPGVSASSAAT